ncbi:MAG: SLC13 family permease [Kiloniellales bacterium]|nr:SLC13 family permease [Kiloniellales bacterium]
MTFEQTAIFLILASTLGLFIWGRIRYDVVAVMALLATVVTGLVSAEGAFAGFGHPAVVTVAAVLILSRALQRSTLTELAARLLRPTTGTPTLHVLALTGLAAICSAFMNNVGALALLLPVAIMSANASGRPVSGLLMPLSFASLLGGLITLIGTPPNIIIASFREEAGGSAFTMFDFAPVGLGVAATGLLFISLLGWRLLPKERSGKVEPSIDFHIEDYLTQVRLPEESPYVGRRLIELENLAQNNLAALALIRRGDRMLAPSGYLRLQAGDMIELETDAATLKRVVEEAALELVGAAEYGAESFRSERVGLVEAVVTPGSRMEGLTARHLRLHTAFGLNLLGVARQGLALTERLGGVRFQAGDVLLLQGESEGIPAALTTLGCLPLAQRELPTQRAAAASILAPGIFGLAILLTVLGLLPLQISFVAAVAALVLLREISLQDLYEGIDWSVIILLGAMIPVGVALDSTGGTMLIAEPIIRLSDNLPVWALLALLMVLTMLLSDVINNAATAVLMAPIGITIAQGLGVSIDPFLMAVAVGASSTFLTPIGHQSNLLVMGPGGYRFGDYWRLGLPLDILIVAVAVPLILQVWPL